MEIESQEVIGVSELGRKLSYYLDKLKSREYQKLLLTRQSTLEAVILPISEYEEMLKTKDDLDHLILATELKEREHADRGKRIPLKKIKQKYGL